MSSDLQTPALLQSRIPRDYNSREIEHLTWQRDNREHTNQESLVNSLLMVRGLTVCLHDPLTTRSSASASTRDLVSKREAART